MNKVFLNLLLLCSIFSLNTYGDSKKSEIKNVTIQKSVSTEKLVWLENVDAAFALAQKEQKRVMIMVEDVTCRWCVKMKKGALSDEKVQENLQKYVLLKIQRSHHANMESLPGLRGPIPSFHFFTAKKKLIDKVAGYYETEDFLGYIKEISEDSL